MKLRWWIIGIAAVTAGSVFMIKHLVDNKNTLPRFVDNNNEKSYCGYPNENFDPEFDDANFIA